MVPASLSFCGIISLLSEPIISLRPYHFDYVSLALGREPFKAKLPAVVYIPELGWVAMLSISSQTPYIDRFRDSKLTLIRIGIPCKTDLEFCLLSVLGQGAEHPERHLEISTAWLSDSHLVP